MCSIYWRILSILTFIGKDCHWRQIYQRHHPENGKILYSGVSTALWKVGILVSQRQKDICFIKAIFVRSKKSSPQNMGQFYSVVFQQPFGKYELLPIKGKKEICFIKTIYVMPKKSFSKEYVGNLQRQDKIHIALCSHSYFLACVAERIFAKKNWKMRILQQGSKKSCYIWNCFFARTKPSSKIYKTKSEDGFDWRIFVTRLQQASE